jgi:hypothetical protein
VGSAVQLIDQEVVASRETFRKRSDAAGKIDRLLIDVEFLGSSLFCVGGRHAGVAEPQAGTLFGRGFQEA